MEVIAYDSQGASVRKVTSTRSGDHNPNWNQYLNFGPGAWKYFKIRAWDSDLFFDNSLSSQQTVAVSVFHELIQYNVLSV